METLTWIKKKKVYLCPVYVSQHHHHTLCHKHQQKDGRKLEKKNRNSSDLQWSGKCSKTQLIKLLDSVLQCQIRRIHTHGCQSAGAFTYRCTAADQADDEEESPDSYDYNSGNQSVHVLEEVVVVIVRDKHVGSDVA